jgi:hypothetical protein
MTFPGFFLLTCYEGLSRPKAEGIADRTEPGRNGEVSPDWMTYTFHLRKDFKFQMEPAGAEAVVFVRAYACEEYGCGANFTSIDKIEVVMHKRSISFSKRPSASSVCAYIHVGAVIFSPSAVKASR